MGAPQWTLLICPSGSNTEDGDSQRSLRNKPGRGPSSVCLWGIIIFLDSTFHLIACALGTVVSSGACGSVLRI